MSDWKYVVMRVGNREVPLIFPGDMIHLFMAGFMRGYFATVAAEASGGILSESAVEAIRNQITVVSAGEVTFDTGHCSGGSETLAVQSRGEVDARLIRTYKYLHGAVDE